MDFIKAIISHLFGGITAPVETPPTRPTQGGYYEGDDSPWIITDNGPMNTRGH